MLRILAHVRPPPVPGRRSHLSMDRFKAGSKYPFAFRSLHMQMNREKRLLRSFCLKATFPPAANVVIR